MANLRPGDYRIGEYVIDTKTGNICKITDMQDSRYTARIKYGMYYLHNSRRVKVGFYKMAKRFKPSPAANILYGHK